MEKMPEKNVSRRDVLKGIGGVAVGALAATSVEARAVEQPDDLKHEQAEIFRITGELEKLQGDEYKELRQKLLKELEGHLKKAIELTK